MARCEARRLKHRNLVVLLDGTWNDPTDTDDGSSAPSNVVKLYEACSKRKGRQELHYQPGVGTHPWEALPGGLYGYGLEEQIQGAYRFLRRRFADRTFTREENRIYIIGFSRGAYAARRLAGLIAHSGLPRLKKDTKLGWELYQEHDTKSSEKLKEEGRFFDTTIRMVGVFDTVKATNDADYHDNILSHNVEHGVHAMAIDEKRKFFPVLKWKKDVRALQVWFAGVHSDVGGGYAQKGLSDLTLKFMIDQAGGLGMLFKARYLRCHVKPSFRGKLHDSHTGIWRILGRRRRRIPPSDWVHNSVRKRRSKIPGYNPKNLPENPCYWPA